MVQKKKNTHKKNSNSTNISRFHHIIAAAILDRLIQWRDVMMMLDAAEIFPEIEARSADRARRIAGGVVATPRLELLDAAIWSQ